MKYKRLCVYCKYFDIDFEGQYTPTIAPSVYCESGCFDVEIPMSLDEFRQTLENGLSCDYFVHVQQ